MTTSDKTNLDTLIFAASDTLTEKNAEYLASFDSSDALIRPSVQRKILRMIRNEERKEKHARVLSSCRRIACVFLVVCTISFALCLSIEGVRTKLFEAVVEWYEDNIGVIFSLKTEAPQTIEIYREPAIQPVGTTRRQIYKSLTKYIVYYEGINEDKSFLFVQRIIKPTEVWYDDDCTAKEISIGGTDILFLDYHKEKRYLLIWSDGEYEYSFCSFDYTIDMDTLISIAKTVK